jgi:hypothetical protein
MYTAAHAAYVSGTANFVIVCDSRVGAMRRHRDETRRDETRRDETTRHDTTHDTTHTTMPTFHDSFRNLNLSFSAGGMSMRPRARLVYSSAVLTADGDASRTNSHIFMRNGT